MDVKRVLYLSYDGMTDPLGQSQVLPYLLGINRNGYQVTLISFEKPERFGKAKAHVQKICDENRIEWYPLMYTKTPPIFSTLKDIRVLKSKIKGLYPANAFDIVHCRSYITALVGLWMKKKWSVRFIFDMRGFWADERTDGGIWNLRNPLFRSVYKFFKNKEREFLLGANYTISLTSNAKREITLWEGSQSFAPIDIIPCCVDLELFNPSTISPEQVVQIKRQLNIQQDQKVLSYIGSIGTWYMLSEMLDFFKVFLQEYKDAVFLFITKEEKRAIEKAVREKQIPLSAVRIIAGERAQMPLLISASDYSIFFIKPSYSKKASSPTKQGEIMAMGIPVICNGAVGDTSDIVEHYHSGVVVHEFTEQAYKNSIEQLLNADFDRSAIRKGAEEFYALQRGIEKYIEVYRKIFT